MLTLTRNPMAKKAADKTTQNRMRDSDDIRKYAMTLRNTAEKMDKLADEMDRVGIRTLKIMGGNFSKGMKFIHNFISKQIVLKMASRGADMGIEMSVSFGPEEKK